MAEPTTTTTADTSIALPDALVLLRTALSSSLPISLVTISSPSTDSTPAPSLAQATHLQFPSLPTSPCLPKSISTRFFSRPNPTKDSSLPSYDLQTLYFGYLNRDSVTAEYLKKARDEKVGFVSVTDRKLVSEYLAGKNEPDAIEKEHRVRELSSDERETLSKVVPDFDIDSTTVRNNSNDNNNNNNDNKREAPTTTTSTVEQDKTNNAVQPIAAPPLKKARYNPDKSDQEKVKRMLQIIQGPQYGHLNTSTGTTTTTNTTTGTGKVDRIGGGATHHTRETVLRGERYNNFDSVRSLIAPRLKTLQESLNSSSSSSSSSTIPQPGSLKPLPSASSKKKQLNPIIMISPSSTALITMHNVKDFLQDSKFVPSDQAKLLSNSSSTSGTGYVTEDVVQINHARASSNSSSSSSNGRVETRMARYFIVDSVEALSKFGGQGREDEAWERVVCVMTTGQEWQFKNYKWKEPKELFHHVKGIYPQWTTDPMSSKIKAWNVSELRIDPHKRHSDKKAVAEFWRGLESWIAEKKPWLSY